MRVRQASEAVAVAASAPCVLGAATAELVHGLTFVDSVVVGEGTQCARPRRGGQFCWGQNRLGQTGTGLESRMVSNPTPVSDTAVMDQGRRASLDCSRS